MIINHKTKQAVSFAPKTGSTSVRAGCLANGFVEIAGHHAMFFGAIPPDYRSIITVRNPYDRAVSLYWHKLWDISTSFSDDPQNPILPIALESAFSFEWFLRWSKDAKEFYSWPQCRWYQRWTDATDQIGIIHCEQIVDACRGQLGFDVGHLNKTNHRPTAHYFNAVTKKIVDERFAVDFATFNYQREIPS